MTSQRLETIYAVIYEDMHGMERIVNEEEDKERAVSEAVFLRNEKENTNDGSRYWSGTIKVSEYERVTENVIGEVMDEMVDDDTGEVEE